MKKILCVVLAVVLLALSLAACGGGGGGKDVIGIWEPVVESEEDSEFSFSLGFGWQFEKNGDIVWVFKNDDGTWTTNEETEALKYLYSMSYKINGDTITITQKLLGGLGGKEKNDYTYSNDGETMYIGTDKFVKVD